MVSRVPFIFAIVSFLVQSVNIFFFQIRRKKLQRTVALCARYRRWKSRKQIITKHNWAATRGRSTFHLSDNQFADQVSLSISS